MVRKFAVVICVIIYYHSLVFSQQQNIVSVTVDVSQQQKPLQNIWAYFGYDEPNYTYMKDGKKLFAEIAAFSITPVYVRTHNLLTTGNGVPALKWGSTNAYTEDANGNAIYNWRIADSIFDTYIQLGMKPVAEIGFMPEALSSHPVPYKHNWKPGRPYNEIYTGWAYPPKDYTKWATLVYEWVKHCVQRYGSAEVSTWLWEVWNEPNIDYWKPNDTAKLKDYLKLYDYTSDAVKRAFPNARIGGPTSTGPSWDVAEKFLRGFLGHCSNGTNAATGKKGAPLDYVTFHAKGSPKFINGHVRMNMIPELTDIIKGCNAVMQSSFKNLPVIIGECDPEGCAACGMATNPENAYRNGTMYSSYTAASFARIHEVVERTGVNIQGAVSWSFEFEDQPWFYGFRDLATNGVDKPVLNVFRMYALMCGNRIYVNNTAELPLDSIMKNGVHNLKRDIGSMATANNNSTAVMLWNYFDDDVPARPQKIALTFKNIPSNAVTVELYRIDSSHSNSYELWKAMGKPENVSSQQYKQLESAGLLSKEILGEHKKITKGLYNVNISLPGQAVYLVRLMYN